MFRTLAAAVVVLGACGAPGAATTSTGGAETPVAPSTAPTTTSTSTTTVDQAGVARTPISCTPAPPGTTEVIQLPQWEDEVVRDLEIEILRSEDGVDVGSGTTPIELQVNSTDEGWIMTWEPAETSVDLVGNPGQGSLLESIDLAPTITYELSSLRLIEDVLNLDEAIGWMTSVFDSIDPSSSEVLSSLTEDQWTAILTADMEVYHSLEGVSLAVDEKWEFDGSLPTAFGLVRSVGLLEVTELIDQDGCVSLRMTMDVDPESLLSAVLALAGEDPPPEEELTEIVNRVQVSRVQEMQFDYATGFVRRVSDTTRGSDGSTESQTKTKIITDVSPP